MSESYYVTHNVSDIAWVFPTYIVWQGSRGYPHDRVVGAAYTLWGAKRAIKQDQRRKTAPQVVYRTDAPDAVA